MPEIKFQSFIYKCKLHIYIYIHIYICRCETNKPVNIFCLYTIDTILQRADDVKEKEV